MTQRALLLTLSELLLPDHFDGPDSRWWAARDLSLLFDNRHHETAVRRAAHRLAESGHVDVSHRDYVTGYRHPAQDREEVYAHRRVLFVRLPPRRRDDVLDVSDDSELAGHFVGLAETIAEFLAARDEDFNAVFVQGHSTATDTKPKALERQRLNDRVRYHRRQLEGVPCPDFAWQWTFARWIAHRRALGDPQIPSWPWSRLPGIGTVASPGW